MRIMVAEPRWLASDYKFLRETFFFSTHRPEFQLLSHDSLDSEDNSEGICLGYPYLEIVVFEGQLYKGDCSVFIRFYFLSRFCALFLVRCALRNLIKNKVQIN